MNAHEVIDFPVKGGVFFEATTYYLPYGTRTIHLRVTNQTGTSQKLWIRPKNVPDNFPQTLVHAFADDDIGKDLWVHWAGGHEPGACAAVRKLKPVRDRSLEAWKAFPIDVAIAEERSVYLNVTHHRGPLKPRTLTLAAFTGDEGNSEVNCHLKLSLTVPNLENGTVANPVRGVWDEHRRELKFTGTQMPNYVSRWWPPKMVNFRSGTELKDVASRLSLRVEQAVNADGQVKDRIFLLNLDGPDGKVLVTIKDQDWDLTVSPMELFQIRPIFAELFHLCTQFYVVRLWFLWFDKTIGKWHEVPDAERVDLLFDVTKKRVIYMGTDLHYRETWGQLKPKEKVGRVELGLSLHNLDHFIFETLDDFLFKKVLRLMRGGQINPVDQIENELCGAGTRATGPRAHVPMLVNIDPFTKLTSPAVIKLE